LFDEATSALDVMSERLIKEALDCVLLGADRQFFIAHRLSGKTPTLASAFLLTRGQCSVSEERGE
jgi:ABC-type bacteriocin/lantibiotic exporter with double-glycine peptidase domain